MVDEVDVKRYQKLDNDLLKRKKVNYMIPLIYDFMGKSFFLKENKFLRMFLNSQLKDEIRFDFEDRKNKVKFLNTEMVKENRKERKQILDILLLVNDSMIIDLELNTQRFKDVFKRNWAYILKVTVSMINNAENSEKNVYQLNINSNVSEKLKANYSMNIFENNDYPKYLNSQIGDYKIFVKNIAYYENLYYNKGEKLAKEHLWLLVLNSRSYVKLYKLLCELLNDRKDVFRFMERVIKMNSDSFILTEAEYQILENIERQSTINNSTADGIIKGKRVGLKQGKKFGLEQGKRVGLEQGKIEIARNMLKDNIDVKNISKYTGLKIEEIKGLKL